jgi:hypothetical protein
LPFLLFGSFGGVQLCAQASLHAAGLPLVDDPLCRSLVYAPLGIVISGSHSCAVAALKGGGELLDEGAQCGLYRAVRGAFFFALRDALLCGFRMWQWGFLSNG